MFRVAVATFCSRTMFSEHTREHDDIFLGDTSKSVTSSGCVVSDGTYGKPDLNRYYFSNMGNNISAINRSNCIHMIRSKEFGINFMNMIKAKFHTTETRGIFVVDYNNSYDGHGNVINHLYQFYSGEGSNIEEHLLKHVRAKSSRELISTYSNGVCEIRLIHFIPASKIEENGYLYDNTTDALFCKNGITKDIIHPFSKHLLNKVEDDGKVVSEPNKVVIDVVDNISSRIFYLNVAGSVYAIYSKVDRNKQDGIYFKTNIAHAVHKDTFVEFANATEHGIFSTREEALSNCNIDKVIETQKLENAMKQLEVTSDELAFKNKELEYKYEELLTKNEELNKKIKLLELDLEVNVGKKELELVKNNNDILKLKAEATMLTMKTRVEIAKLTADMIKDRSSSYMAIVKHKIELAILENKLDAESNNNLHKLSDFLLKGASILINQFK